MLLPTHVHYLQCVQASILSVDTRAVHEHAKGFHGTLQHVCAAACFDYYVSVAPRVRGVIWQADDQFVNYTALFTDYPSRKAWSPSRSHDSLLHLNNQSMHSTEDYWSATPIGNLFAARAAARLLQSDATYRRAWLLVFGSLDAMSAKAIADFFYLPQHQLRTYVDITSFLRYSPEQYVTVDTPDSSGTVTVRVGLTMCEWWTRYAGEADGSCARTTSV